MCFTASIGVVALWPGEKEPVYNGMKLSEWMELARPDDPRPEQSGPVARAKHSAWHTSFKSRIFLELLYGSRVFVIERFPKTFSSTISKKYFSKFSHSCLQRLSGC
jgi:hypothetical protein